MIHKTINEKTRFKIEAESKEKEIDKYRSKVNDQNEKLKQQQQSLEKYKTVLRQA